MKKSIDDQIHSDQGYQVRGVIARMGQVMGYYNEGILVKQPIHQFLSLDCGDGHKSIVVKFDRPAPFIRDADGYPFVDFSKIKEGEILVAPAFIYTKTQWTDPLIAAHLEALKTYKRKVIISHEVDRSKPSQEIVIDPNNISKQ